MPMAPKDSYTLAAITHIASTAEDRMVRRDARRMQRRLKARPMFEILALVPGTSVSDRCRALGISRTTYYSWYNGLTRPRDMAAARMAKLTKLSVDVIRGTADE